MERVSIIITGGVWDNKVDEAYQITEEMLLDEARDAVELFKEKNIFAGCKIKIKAGK